MSGAALPIRRYGRLRAPDIQPHLLSLRFASYDKFLSEGIEDALRSMTAIETDTPWPVKIWLRDSELIMPERNPGLRWREGLSYAADLYCKAVMQDGRTGEIKEQRFKLCEMPLLDDCGSFVINGVRRVVIHQIVRAPGPYFSAEREPLSGRLLGRAVIMPERGVWLSFETTENDVLKARLNSGGKAVSAIAILRAFGFSTDDDIYDAFIGAGDGSRPFILNSLEAEECVSEEDAWLQLYDAVSPGAFATAEIAEDAVRSVFEKPRYDLSPLGRYMMNRRFGVNDEGMTLSSDDVARTLSAMMDVSNGVAEPTDVDDLANRRVRAPGDTVYNELSAGLYAMARETRRKIDMSNDMPKRPLDVLMYQNVSQRLNSFFSGSKLCQTADETNPIAELTHKRRVTSLGPGGLSRRSAGVEPRDVHHTHYGRICPVETPEGQNIGLLCTLTLEAQIDKLGFLTAPLRKVFGSVSSHSADIAGRILAEEAADVGLSAGDILDDETCVAFRDLPERDLDVCPFVLLDGTGVEYLNAYEERSVVIGQATVDIDDLGQIVSPSAPARRGHDWIEISPRELDYLDLLPRQIISASTSLIPFLDHNDANRALMGCNMQRQAVPLVAPQSSLVSTGSESFIAADSGYQLKAPFDGWISECTGDRISVSSYDGEIRSFDLRRFERSNQFTCIDQRPLVSRYDVVHKGQALVDSHASRDGELALGQRVVVAYMSWEGYNYEDAIILSERVVRAAKFRTRVIKRFRVRAMDIVGVGEERITADIPGVPREKLKHLDADGIVKLGSYVKAGDALVGKLTPRLNPIERKLTPQDKLLLKVFDLDDTIRFVNTSLTLPKGQDGRVVDIRIVRRDDDTEAAANLDKLCLVYIEVLVIGTRDVQPGDKMSGRHGNKGCVSIVVAEQDMPFMEDGTPVDVMLSPLGVPSRMNLGQLMEVHLGWAAHRLGFRAVTRAFDSATSTQVEQALGQAWLMEYAGGLPPSRRMPEDDVYSPDWDAVRRWCVDKGYDFEALFSESAAMDTTYPAETALRLWLRDNGVDDGAFADYKALLSEALRLNAEGGWGQVSPITGKQWLRDGRTGERMGMATMVGVKYMLRLVHMVADKMHARSTGPYSAVTQQPLKGKSNLGGQRFGEMEVWALEGYSAAHTLREMMTIKSDDVEGRYRMFSAIMRDSMMAAASDTSVAPDLPSAFWLLVNELRALGFSLDFMDGDRVLDWGADARPGIEASGISFFDELPPLDDDDAPDDESEIEADDASKVADNADFKVYDIPDRDIALLLNKIEHRKRRLAAEQK